MPGLMIDGKKVEVPAGATVLEAAGELGIAIPTLCHLDGRPPLGTCMLCVVEDVAGRRYIPACSAEAREGMRIRTGGPEIHRLRREALELLLSDHAGDCTAPCERACPAHLNIPAVLRAIGRGDFTAAMELCLDRLPLPATISAVCPAPCQKICRRAPADVAIRRLVGFVASLSETLSPEPGRSGTAIAAKKVAVVGAGPAGLSASYYLRRMGYRCTLYERDSRPGGGLLKAPSLNEAVRDQEIEGLLERGVTLETGRELGRDLRLSELVEGWDAVVLALGEPGSSPVREELSVREEWERKVYRCGAMVRQSRMAVRAAAHGREVAFRIDHDLRRDADAETDRDLDGAPRRFDFHLGPLQEGELEGLLHSVPPVVPAEDGDPMGPAAAVEESRRCLGCDCAAGESCRLRELAGRYGAANRSHGARRRLERITGHPDIVYEPGKCILCGRCIRISAGEELGLALQGRGFGVRVGVPFGESLAAGLRDTALACAAACPTGAIVARRREE